MASEHSSWQVKGEGIPLDVGIFNQSYEDNQLHHLADLVGGERIARLLLSCAG